MVAICTNIEQSIELLNLGFAANIADMWWTQYELVNGPTPMLMKINGVVLNTYRTDPEDVPAWSLPLLLQSLPASIDWDGESFDLNITKTGNIYMVAYANKTSTLIYRDCDDLVDGIVKIIVWMLTNKIQLNPIYLYNNI